MPPALKAFLAQLTGWMIALLLVRAAVIPSGALYVVGTQAMAACAVAYVLRSAPWWLPIHLLFAPLLISANQLGIPSYVYLLAFIALTLVYWSTFRTQVPLYLSNLPTAAAVLEQLPQDRPIRMLDIGSGTGALLIPLARSRPDSRFIGIETAPGPFWLSRLMGRQLANLDFERGDFFKHPWSDYDVVYAFLSPVPMVNVWKKFLRESPSGALLISNSFEVPAVSAEKVVQVEDGRGTCLYLYRRPDHAHGDERLIAPQPHKAEE